VDGIVGTRRPGGAPWQALLGTAPVGPWTVELPDTALVRAWFADGLITDVVLVFTLSAVTPAWPA
jgi:hypothetical protein